MADPPFRHLFELRNDGLDFPPHRQVLACVIWSTRFLSSGRAMNANRIGHQPYGGTYMGHVFSWNLDQLLRPEHGHSVQHLTVPGTIRDSATSPLLLASGNLPLSFIIWQAW